MKTESRSRQCALVFESSKVTEECAYTTRPGKKKLIEAKQKAVASVLAQAIEKSTERIQVAKKIDEWLILLAPLLREWREVDDAVSRLTVDALRRVCGGARCGACVNSLEAVEHVAPRNAIALSVAQVLCMSNLQDLLQGHVEMDYVSVIDFQHAPLTAQALAFQADQHLANSFLQFTKNQIPERATNKTSVAPAGIASGH